MKPYTDILPDDRMVLLYCCAMAYTRVPVRISALIRIINIIRELARSQGLTFCVSYTRYLVPGVQQ